MQGANPLGMSLLEQLQRPSNSVHSDAQKQQLASLQQHLQGAQAQAQNRAAGIDLASQTLLSAFSAQMPRENSGTPKPLGEDLFSFAQRDQLSRLAQPGLTQQQPQHLGAPL